MGDHGNYRELDVDEKDEELRQKASRFEAEALRKAQAEEEEEEEEEQEEEDEEVTGAEEEFEHPSKEVLDIRMKEEMLEEEEEINRVTIDSSSSSIRGGPVYFMRLVFYALLFLLSFVTLIYLVLPVVVPSCCDYRKDFLVFNEQNYYNEDGMLPF